MSGPATKLTRESPLEERAPEVIRLLEEEYPDATVALAFSNPLECLVATILSAQATDKKVNEVTQGFLFEKYRSAEDYLSVAEAELANDLRPTGFFNQKTKAVRGACRMIVEEFDGNVPDSMADLVRLPGVARKTANIVLWNSYPEKARRDPDAGIAVDTHVRRVSQRLGLTQQKDPDKIERDLMAVVPREDWFHFAYVLIEHGRAVCKAPTPKCEECPVNHLCPSSLV
ncbi:MAG TPA: endonuclease III [Actinomycetota bacterium]|jgi:endonuclease-3|nr:endonuclease III [Actinomycetota bacterium]